MVGCPGLRFLLRSALHQRAKTKHAGGTIMNRRFLLKSSILLFIPRMAQSQVFMDIKFDMLGFRFTPTSEQKLIDEFNVGFPAKSIFFEHQRIGFVNSIWKDGSQWMVNVRIENEYVSLIQSGEIQINPYKIALINGEESSVILGNFEAFKRDEFEIIKKIRHYNVTMF
jgi:hypothetical protein